MKELGDLGIINAIGAIWFLVDWAIRIVALFIVPPNRKPTSGTAWLLFIFLLPMLGMLFFLILGSPKLPKSRRDAQKTLDGIIKTTLKNLRHKHDRKALLTAKPPAKYNQLATLSESLSGMPVFSGNNVELIPEYNDAIDRIVFDIDQAKQYIHMEYFIIVMDDITLPIFDALQRAVKRGVIVRVMYDSLSTKRYPRHKEMTQRLIDDGVQVQPMLALRLPGKGYVRPDLRNHRKLIVIDDTTGYTGSQNLVQRDYHRKDKIYYDEMVVRVQGPVVLQLSAIFSTDWYSETGKLLTYKDDGGVMPDIKSYGNSLAQVLPSGPGYDDENNLKLFASLIHTAQRKVVITNPYFVPDDALTNALTTAARRGVEIKIINSEVMDQWMVGHAQRSFYEEFLKVGVKIYLYNAPILLHSKFMTVDDDIVLVGSSNLDIRSFLLDLELTLICYDEKVVKEFNKIESQYLAKSKEIKIKKWLARTKAQNLMDNIARLTSALQ